jgi:hypothetical protein
MTGDAWTQEQIGALWLRAALAPAGDFGRRAEDAAQLYGPGDEVVARARCAQIVALAESLDRDGVAHVRAALRRAPDPIEIVSRANAGDALGDVDFFELGRFVDALDATARAWDRAGGGELGRPPVLPELGALLAPGRAGGTFYLAAGFGVSLAAARDAYERADAELVRERLRLARALEPLIGMLPETEEFIVMRERAPAVPPGVRVVRETPAYRLLALELDSAALAAAARRDQTSADLAAQEDRARRDLATEIARQGDALLAASEALGQLDRTLARVALTQVWGGCVPTLTTGSFAFESASFVPLRAALLAQGLSYTPISLDLPGVAVLTGPNMGGKSAALATAGFLAACVAHGLPPPAMRAALPLFGSVAWIGGDVAADRTRLLSAFGGEVVRARDALAGAARPALFLVDEFARTTGPREGRALLVAFVEALVRRADFALVATHFDGVARDAGVAHFTIAGLGEGSLDVRAAGDIRAALDAVAHAMDYRIIRVAGEAHAHSDALALAGLLGLDPAIVERAAELYAGSPTGARRSVTE